MYRICAFTEADITSGTSSTHLALFTYISSTTTALLNTQLSLHLKVKHHQNFRKSFMTFFTVPACPLLQHKASVACTPYQLFRSLGRTLNLTVSRRLLLSPKLSPVAFRRSVNIHSPTNDVSLNLTVNRSLLGSLRPEHFTAAMHYPVARYRRTSVSRSLIISHALQEKIYHNITSHPSTCWTQLIAVRIQR